MSWKSDLVEDQQVAYVTFITLGNPTPLSLCYFATFKYGQWPNQYCKLATASRGVKVTFSHFVACYISVMR